MARATASLRPQPPNFKSIVAINRGPLDRRTVDAHPLTPRQIQTLDAPVIDVRTSLQFDDAHIPGAICNTILQAGFGTRLAWIAGPDEEIVLVGRDDADALHAAELAAAVGVDRIAGYLAGGMTSWREEKLPVASIERLTVHELHERRDGVQILDVRERDEWEAGHIPGSVFVPYHDIHALPGVDAERAGRGDLRVAASARRWARRWCSASARPRCCTWSTAASARGGARATRSSAERGGRAVASWRMAVPRLRVSSAEPSGTLRQASDEVELYHRTYTTLLRSSGETLLRVLEPSHAAMNSSLHPLAYDMEQPDLGAFLYSLRRLPSSVWRANVIVDGPGVRGVRARRASAGSRTGSRSRRPRAGGAGTTTARARSPCCSPPRRTSTTRSRRSSPTSSSGTSCTRCCARPSCPRTRTPADVAEACGGSEGDWTRVERVLAGRAARVRRRGARRAS